jgi:DNA-binding transcriptional MerR regulator
MGSMMNDTPPPPYTIQQVSAQTGVPASTLRYYEDIGLLDAVPRAANGHRRYGEADLRRITLIKRLRLTGMSIEAMCDFIALYRGGASTARQRRAILLVHRQQVQARADELCEMLAFIDMKIGLYEAEERTHDEHEISVIG